MFVIKVMEKKCKEQAKPTRRYTLELGDVRKIGVDVQISTRDGKLLFSGNGECNEAYIFDVEVLCGEKLSSKEGSEKEDLKFESEVLSGYLGVFSKKMSNTELKEKIIEKFNRTLGRLWSITLK